MATDILMLHYNDVYNAEPLPPPAGTPAGSKAYIAAESNITRARLGAPSPAPPALLPVPEPSL
jgi:hypothetical protein